MKMTYLIIGLLAFSGLAFYLASCKNKQNSKQTEDYISKTGDTVKVHNLPDNRFLDLRNMALAVTSEQLQITLPADQTKIYGVVMDWDLGDGTATFISFSTGDASMYLSSGGGLIGGGQHENVSTAAKAFIDKAQQYLDKTAKVDSTPLPDKNCVRFYFMTNKGKFSAQENLKNFDNSSSPWLPLLEEGNKVISELRLIQEKK
jgi:hypothetical protein